MKKKLSGFPKYERDNVKDKIVLKKKKKKKTHNNIIIVIPAKLGN